MNKKDAKCELFHKWMNVVLCFFTIMICLGFCSSNKSIFLSPITEALNINRSVFSVSDSIRYISMAVANMFFGILVSKFSTKKLLLAGITSLILFSLIYSVAENVIWFYVGGFLLGIGLSVTTTSMIGCIVNRWFTTGKGTITGIILASNGIGAAISTQVLSPIIYRENNAFGYRDAYMLTALILIVLLFSILFLFKEKKSPALPTDSTEKRMKQKSEIKLFSATASKHLWFSIIIVFLTGMIIQGTFDITAAHLKDVGMDSDFIATIISIYAITISVAKLAVGVIYDKLGFRFTMLFCHIMSVASLFLFCIVTASHSGQIISLIYAVVLALALPLETVVLPLFAQELSKGKSYDKILGIFVSSNAAGSAVGITIMNIVFDVFGSYRPILIILCFVMIVLMVVFQFFLKQMKNPVNAEF